MLHLTHDNEVSLLSLVTIFVLENRAHTKYEACKLLRMQQMAQALVSGAASVSHMAHPMQL